MQGKISKITEYTKILLSQLTIEDISKLSIENTPLSMIDKQYINIEEKTSQFEFNAQNTLNFLLENIDDDFLCAQKIYQLFNRLEQIDLLDTNIWSYYSLEVFWPYTYEKYFKNEKNRSNYLKRCLLLDNHNMSLLNNSISRLFWITYKTRNTKYENNYEITEYIYKQPLNEVFFDSELLINKIFIEKFIISLKQIDDSSWKISKLDKGFLEILRQIYMSKAIYTLIDLISKEEHEKIIKDAYHKYASSIANSSS